MMTSVDVQRSIKFHRNLRTFALSFLVLSVVFAALNAFAGYLWITFIWVANVGIWFINIQQNTVTIKLLQSRLLLLQETQK